MSDAKKVNVPFTYVRVPTNATSNSAVNLKELEQAFGSSRSSVTHEYERRQFKSRQPASQEKKDATKETHKAGRLLLCLCLNRILNKKMYDHLCTIKDAKRKLMYRRAFLKTLSLLETRKTVQLKNLAFLTLMRNTYHIDKKTIEHSTVQATKGLSGNTKKGILMLKRRYSRLLKTAIDKISKNSKKVSLFLSPLNNLSFLTHRKQNKMKAFAMFKMKRVSKKWEVFKLGFNSLKNLFNLKMAKNLTILRNLPKNKIQSTPAKQPARQTRTGSFSSSSQQTTARRPGSQVIKPQPSEEEKLNAKIEQLRKQKDSINEKTQQQLQNIQENINIIEQRIADETNKKKELEKTKKQKPSSPAKTNTPSPTKSQEAEKDPYFQILRTIYESVSIGPDTLRKRDFITRFELDIDQLQDTVEHELDRNQELKDTINHIEDFLCPDQAIQRPEIQIDEANRLLDHENLQLKKILQRYLIESYGRNLIQEAKKCYDVLSDKLTQQKVSKR